MSVSPPTVLSAGSSSWEPDPTHPDYEPYWTGCSEERLMVPVCSVGHPFWPPRPRCSVCFAPAERWTEASGHGRLYSWTVVHRTRDLELAGQVPYVVGMIELDDISAVRMVGRIDVDPSRLVDGLEVDVTFSAPRRGVRLPRWRPRSQSPLNGVGDE